MGNGWCKVLCFDNHIRRCHIRLSNVHRKRSNGKMRSIKMSSGDIVLVSLRDFQSDTGDIILKYTEREASHLRAQRELGSRARLRTEVVLGEAREIDIDSI